MPAALLSKVLAGVRWLSRDERERRRDLRQGQLEVATFHKERDPEENRQTTPPDGEAVVLHCVWAVEFYTPAHMDDLIKNLLRFNRASSLSEHDAEPLDSWIKQFHKVAYGGGWANLGTWEPKGVPRKFIGPSRVVDMPPTVAYALAKAHRISPAIMCIAVCFVFKGDFSTSFDTALRTSRDTYTRPISSGFSIHTPRDQKTEAIELIRSQISDDFTDWFREHIPGIFSSDPIDGRVPICEFLTLQKATPFVARETRSTADLEYLRILGLDANWEAWRHSSAPELHFSIQRERRGAPLRYSTLSANEPGFLSRVGDYGGHKGQLAQILYLDSSMGDLLCMWSGLSLFDVFTETLNRVRNSGDYRFGQSGNSVDNLQRLQDHIFSLSNIGAVSTEFSNDIDALVWDSRSTRMFVPCEPELYSPDDTLLTVFERRISERSNWLQRTESAVRDQLVQTGAIINASENVRLQKNVNKLTWLVVFLTVCAVVIGGLQLSGVDWVLGLLQKIGDSIVIATDAFSP